MSALSKYEMTPTQRTAFRAGKVIGRDEALREAAEVVGAHCEKYGVLGVGDLLLRMADAVARPSSTPVELPSLQLAGAVLADVTEGGESL